MVRKNKILLIFISLLFIVLGLLLLSLRQVLSEEQMKQMVESFVMREVSEGKAEVGEIHLNFRRTLEIHFEGLSVTGGDGLDISAERVMLSIPYGNFIFRSGRVDVKVTSSEIRYGSEMSVDGFVQTLELLKEIPSLVGLETEVNLKLSDPVFTPQSPFFDFYQPRFSRLVVNNIGRNSDLAVELIGSLVEKGQLKSFRLIGSINPERKRLTSTLSVDSLDFPIAGYRGNGFRLKVNYEDEGWNISGLSEDQVEIEMIASALTPYEVKRLFFPFGTSILRNLWKGSSAREGLTLTGVWSEDDEEKRELQIIEKGHSLQLDAERYEANLTGTLTSSEQNYRIGITRLSESATIDLSFKDMPSQVSLKDIEVNIQNMDLTRAEAHPLIARLSSLGSFATPETAAQVKLSDIKYENYTLNAQAKLGPEKKELILEIPELASKLDISEKQQKISASMIQLPCQLPERLLKKSFPWGLCNGQINYDLALKRGSFKLQWEPEGMFDSLTNSSPLGLVGGIEKVWNLEGAIEDDQLIFKIIKGKTYHFDGEATGSLSKQTLHLNGALKMKRQTLGKINVEISERGIKNLNEDNR